MTLDAFFHGTAGRGARLYLHHRPAAQAPLRGCVLAVHSFAEEMNKSRRMVALTARGLAQAGWSVLQLDLLGCGDSSGEFEEATWIDWLDDVTEAAHWLQLRHPTTPLWLWGQRSGALLAVQAAARLDTSANLLLWQPVSQGKTALQQFMRLKAAAQLADGHGKAILDAARADLAAGRAVDIGGYALNPALARGWQAATLVPPEAPGEGLSGTPGQLVLLEVSSQPSSEPSPAAQAALQRWRAAGWDARAQTVVGPPFWQATEIEDAPALVAATVEALSLTPEPVGARRNSHQSHAESEQNRAAQSQWREQPMIFRCEGQDLAGVLHPSLSETGVVIVVGGPQYRAGSHRQFVQLARALAAAGYPTLRFDVRGMGDSSGQLHTFEQITPDIGAAVELLLSAQPQLRRVVLWGLCDGASAALMYCAATRDARVSGLCLVNPWVRSTQSLAQTRVKHYYLQRLGQLSFWRKLLGGQVAGRALGELFGNLRSARSRPERAPAKTGQAGPFQQRMLAGLADNPVRPILLLLSGGDYTAKEFVAYTQAREDWTAALASPRVQRVEIALADHTFSNNGSHRVAEEATVTWLQQFLQVQ